MKQIYTKTGDEGMTSLRDGVRVPKDDPRIETNGQPFGCRAVDAR